MRNLEILAVVLAVLLGVLVVGCGSHQPPAAMPLCRVDVAIYDTAESRAECCDDACNFTSSVGCPVGPVPPRKGRRS